MGSGANRSLRCTLFKKVYKTPDPRAHPQKRSFTPKSTPKEPQNPEHRSILDVKTPKSIEALGVRAPGPQNLEPQPPGSGVLRLQPQAPGALIGPQILTRNSKLNSPRKFWSPKNPELPVISRGPEGALPTDPLIFRQPEAPLPVARRVLRKLSKRPPGRKSAEKTKLQS